MNPSMDRQTVRALRACGRPDLATDFAQLRGIKPRLTNPMKIAAYALALWAVIGVLVWMLLQGRA